MDFDLGWLLWGLPLVFVLGWVASRLDLRQMRSKFGQLGFPPASLPPDRKKKKFSSCGRCRSRRIPFD